jgi:hypothetical protein
VAWEREPRRRWGGWTEDPSAGLLKNKKAFHPEPSARDHEVRG